MPKSQETSDQLEILIPVYRTEKVGHCPKVRKPPIDEKFSSLINLVGTPPVANLLTLIHLLEDGLVLGARWSHHACVQLTLSAIEVNREGGWFVNLQEDTTVSDELNT